MQLAIPGYRCGPRIGRPQICRLRLQLADAINETYWCAYIFVDVAPARPCCLIRPHRQKWYVIRQDG